MSTIDLRATQEPVTALEAQMRALPAPTQRMLIQVQMPSDADTRKAIKTWLETNYVRYYPLNNGVLSVDLFSFNGRR